MLTRDFVIYHDFVIHQTNRTEKLWSTASLPKIRLAYDNYVQQNCWAFYKRDHYLPFWQIERAYIALIHPVLEYGNAVWDPYTEENSMKTESVQRTAARWVSNRHRQTTSMGDMLENPQWPSPKTKPLTTLYKSYTGDLVINSTTKPKKEINPQIQHQKLSLLLLPAENAKRFFHAPYFSFCSKVPVLHLNGHHANIAGPNGDKQLLS